MASTIDINVVEVSKQKSTDFISSKLEVKLEGKQVNASLVNCFRIIAQNNIPTYAFFSPNILIEENSSIFDNDTMRLRLEQITFPNVSTKIDILEDRYWATIDYSNKDREKDPRDVKILELVVNQVNNTDKVLNVTTNMVKFFEDGSEITTGLSSKKYPDLIIKLRPTEVFKCYCKASLGCGQRNNIWAAAHSYFYDELDDKGREVFNLILESQEQLDEYDILIKACAIIKNKLTMIQSMMFKNKLDKDKVVDNITLVLTGEDYAIAGCLNEYLQNNVNLHSGISKPDLQKLEVVIKITKLGNEKKDIYVYIKETFEFMHELFDTLCNKFTRMSKNKK